MDWQLVASYFTVKSTDIVCSAYAQSVPGPWCTLPSWMFSLSGWAYTDTFDSVYKSREPCLTHVTQIHRFLGCSTVAGSSTKRQTFFVHPRVADTVKTQCKVHSLMEMTKMSSDTVFLASAKLHTSP